MKNKSTMLLVLLLSVNLVHAQILNISGVKYGTVNVEGLAIFYREAGSPDKPTILLLHGFPTSSHMFRNLILALQDKYHLIAPDYPGFGASSMPTVQQFDYSFDHLEKIIDQFTIAKGLKKYSIYLMDYGAPVGFRLAIAHPERVQSLIIQNGNAYEEGLGDFWKQFRVYWKDPKSVENSNMMKKLLTLPSTKWQYMDGVGDSTLISPDNWIIDQARLDRPNNVDIQLSLMYSYSTNPPSYPFWQAYLRKYQPPTIVLWGRYDSAFPASGANAYKKDLKNVQVFLFPTGHFALEEYGFEIAKHIDAFLAANSIK